MNISEHLAKYITIALVPIFIVLMWLGIGADRDGYVSEAELQEITQRVDLAREAERQKRVAEFLSPDSIQRHYDELYRAAFVPYAPNSPIYPEPPTPSKELSNAFIIESLQRISQEASYSPQARAAAQELLQSAR